MYPLYSVKIRETLISKVFKVGIARNPLLGYFMTYVLIVGPSIVYFSSLVSIGADLLQPFTGFRAGVLSNTVFVLGGISFKTSLSVEAQQAFFDLSLGSFQQSQLAGLYERYQVLRNGYYLLTLNGGSISDLNAYVAIVREQLQLFSKPPLVVAKETQTIFTRAYACFLDVIFLLLKAA